MREKFVFTTVWKRSSGVGWGTANATKQINPHAWHECWAYSAEKLQCWCHAIKCTSNFQLQAVLYSITQRVADQRETCYPKASPQGRDPFATRSSAPTSLSPFHITNLYLAYIIFDSSTVLHMPSSVETRHGLCLIPLSSSLNWELALARTLGHWRLNYMQHK